MNFQYFDSQTICFLSSRGRCLINVLLSYEYPSRLETPSNLFVPAELFVSIQFFHHENIWAPLIWIFSCFEAKSVVKLDSCLIGAHYLAVNLKKEIKMDEFGSLEKRCCSVGRRWNPSFRIHPMLFQKIAHPPCNMTTMYKKVLLTESASWHPFLSLRGRRYNATVTWRPPVVVSCSELPCF